MDDLSRKISEILSDPEAMQQIRGLTGLLSSAGSSAEKSTDTFGTDDSSSVSASEEKESSYSNIFPGGLPEQGLMDILMKVVPLMQSYGKEDDRTRLLRALKPFLSEERSKRVDGAIRLLGVLRFLPLLKSSDINLFGS